MEHPLGLLHPHLAFIQHCPILTTTLLFGVYQLILSLESNGTSLTTTPSPRCSPQAIICITFWFILPVFLYAKTQKFAYIVSVYHFTIYKIAYRLLCFSPRFIIFLYLCPWNRSILVHRALPQFLNSCVVFPCRHGQGVFFLAAPYRDYLGHFQFFSY